MLQHLKYLVAPVTTIALLTSCGDGLSTPATPLASQQNQSHTGRRATSACPCLYVANWNNSVTVYAAGATGNAKPIQNIAGSRTGLGEVWGIAVDGSGNMYVANYYDNSVRVFAAGATGNAKPIQVISGNYTGLNGPKGIALDPVNGDIYVANASGGPSSVGSVTIYAQGWTGNVAPIGTIAGASTGLSSPEGLVLDASGNIYVPNDGDATVTVYAAGAVGNVAPTRTINGSKAKLDGPSQLALDSSSNVYVANDNGPSPTYGDVTVYAAGASGNVAPIQTIKGGKTKLDNPDGIALDGSDNIYVGNFSDNKLVGTVTVYAAGANGVVAPINTIKGAKTKMGYPTGIAIR